MRAARPPLDRRPEELTEEEAAAIFADQARTAREHALSDAERQAFEKSPRVRGPIWVVLPVAILAVLTFPLWALFAAPILVRRADKARRD